MNDIQFLLLEDQLGAVGRLEDCSFDLAKLLQI